MNQFMIGLKGLKQSASHRLVNLRLDRVERIVASPLPHRPVRVDFPHTVPPFTVSL